MASALKDLAKAAGRQDWVAIEDIDILLRQRQLSRAIDQASYDQLAAGAPDSHFKVLALSSAIIFKTVFFLKMHWSKVMVSFTYCDGINGPTAYLRRRSLLHTLKRLTR